LVLAVANSIFSPIIAGTSRKRPKRRFPHWRADTP
jgi:hypothetical protein